MQALRSCRDALEHRLPLIVTLGMPAVFGIAAAFATAMFADRAEPEDLDAALTALITLNAVVVGLVYATVRRAVQMLRVVQILASSKEAEAFGLATVWMFGGSLVGVFLAVVHLGWHPQWGLLPLTMGLLVAAPIVTPLLAVQEQFAAREATALFEDELEEDAGDSGRGSFEAFGLIRVRAREFVADPANPFANDVLGRETHVRSFCAVLAGVQPPAVFSVDADWGQGKTAFLKMCAALMRSDAYTSRGVAVAEFNAWTQNYHDDPLKDIVSAVTSQITDTDAENRKKIARLLRQAAAQVASGGLLPDEVFTVEDSARRNVEKFRKALARYAAGCGGRLVVFVDELDRCRPGYALGVLERIRHLFDVGGVMVVLAVNPEALNHSTGTMHSPAETAERYLRRLIDQRVRLPTCEDNATVQFVDHVCDEAGLLERWDAKGYTLLMLHSVTRLPGTSLRDIEQTVHRVALVTASLRHPTEGIPDAAWAWEQTAMTLMALRRVDEQTYWAVVGNETKRFAAIMALRKAPILDEPFLMTRMEVLLLLARPDSLREDPDRAIWQRYTDAGWADEVPNLKHLYEEFSIQIAGDEPDIRVLASIIELTADDPQRETAAGRRYR